ncbi:unnamed protein product [Urochloa humidicola]
MANGLSLSSRDVLLVLTIAHAAVAAVAAALGAPAEAPALARQLFLPLEYSLLQPPTEPAGTVVPPPAAACVQAVLEASRPCAADVIQTLVFKTVRLSADCCRVLAGVGEECVAAMFSGGGDVGPTLLPAVNSVCGLVASIG